MTGSIFPFHFLLVTLSDWLNQHQQVVIDYLSTENRILKTQLKDRRLQLSDYRFGAIRADEFCERAKEIS